ncbi:MAG: redox-sensing transcriptional repressor Rex [Calditrichaeota bacterium]|nr:redox-sensing transcriptional repressor Rex [Calditrichota bacterium]RQV93512.1 MAG: redox-sensing transcriptional repressor Rex [bacterium]RQW06426.1 MAG: redox-sensing transcriptional repressor Rex [Calditrichota bacterium]
MKKISDSTIRRMSKYYRSLDQLIDKRVETVSSDTLAEMDGITSAQVRKDLSFFGTFGKRGFGYNTKALKKQIENILGLYRTWNVAIVGAGNIGRALTDYAEFKKQGFIIRLIMDRDKSKIGQQVRGLNIEDFNKVNDLVKDEQIDIAIIAVPADAAQAVADKLVTAGIKAILNFAPRSLKVPPDVTVKYENMAVEMEALSYFLSKKK